MNTKVEQLLVEWEEAASERPLTAEEFFAIHPEVQQDAGLESLVIAEAARHTQIKAAFRKSARANRQSVALETPGEHLLFEGYTFLDSLGQGGSGHVYLMCDQQGRRVAVKYLHRADPTDVARLGQEAELIQRLVHPHIVRLIEYRHDVSRPVLVMEYVAGQNLKEAFATERPSFAQAATIVEQMAGALAYAHDNEVIHRDLKPSNVLITADGVKVLDFGLAKQIGADTDYTRTGQCLGTPQYMAPEQFDGNQKAVTPAVDVYGMGGVLYYLLTGKPVREVVWDQEPHFVRSFNPAVPRELEAICMKCLARNPAQRYKSAEELQFDLQRFLKQQRVQAPLITAKRRISAHLRRYPGRWLTFGLLAAVTMCAVLLWISNNRPGAEVVDAAYMLQHLQKTPFDDRDELFKREYLGRRVRSRGQLANVASLASPSATNSTLTEGLCASFNDVNDVLIIASFDESQRNTVLSLPHGREFQMEGIVTGYILPDRDAMGIPENSPIPFEESWDGRPTLYIENASFPTVSVVAPPLGAPLTEPGGRQPEPAPELEAAPPPPPSQEPTTPRESQ